MLVRRANSPRRTSPASLRCGFGRGFGIPLEPANPIFFVLQILKALTHLESYAKFSQANSRPAHRLPKTKIANKNQAKLPINISCFQPHIEAQLLRLVEVNVGNPSPKKSQTVHLRARNPMGWPYSEDPDESFSIGFCQTLAIARFISVAFVVAHSGASASKRPTRFSLRRP